jgi:glycosyltransferase involved in cell wall biosynthesis
MSDSAPLVTVIVPTYNRADLIGETLESIAAQTFTDWECLVIDDGSTDDTRAVVEGFSAREPRFRYVWQENASAASARNHGIRLARGKYIAFVDSDDLFTPDRLEWQVKAAEADPELVLVYGHTYNFRTGQEDKGRLYLADLPSRPTGWAFEDLICCSSIYAPLVRTETIRELGGFDTSLPSAEDWDMWIRLSKRGKLLFEPRIALRYRIHAGNKSSVIARNYRCAKEVVRKNTADLPWLKRRKLRRKAKLYFRRVYTPRMLKDAHRLGRMGLWVQARPIWRALLELNPAVIGKPGVWPNALWALLPTDREPIWRARAALRREERDAPGA